MKTYDIVLIEKPLDEGLTKQECDKMFDMISGQEAITLDIQGENSAAMGFISVSAAEKMEYNMSVLKMFVTNVLNDMGCESDTGEYTLSERNPEGDIKYEILMRREL